ncbi:PaaI family thioesterase [Patulibacter defluvii]|uniref:PaaI family thioesterase n=1 Tax=Patulibacter defluvii TaxID=3095358 RepID=UPI002A751BC1|nr:PaaI family thioesterase [Patulibacter sp. DM4]
MIRPDGSLEHHPHCLGCGSENPAGMGLRIRAEGDRIRGEVRFDRRQEGAPGIAHGGAVATVLDDALGSVLMLLRRPAVTANLNIDYRAPAFLDRDLRLEAWSSGVEGRKIQLHGVLRDGETTIAEARALFLEVDLEHFRRSGQPLPDAWEGWPQAPETPIAP